MTILRTDEFNYEKLSEYGTLKRTRREKGKRYLNCIAAFDIETSRIKEIEQSVMYIWQFQLEDQTVIGRTWEEFKQLLLNIRKYITGSCMVIYVHNLSYEFQFLKGIYDFQAEEVFATDNRKVLKCNMLECFEFRCSYQLTGLSLDQFTKRYNVENLKMSGAEFNYDKLRLPSTPLTDRELAYCVNDVKGLVQAIKKKLTLEGLTVANVPLTKTGYVRNDVRKALQNNVKGIRNILPSTPVYLLLREAFRGGNTMSNRYYTDEIIENVRSVDIVSSYPNVLLKYKLPMSKFYPEEDCNVSTLKALLGKKALLFRISFTNIRLTQITCGCPYLSKDKCRYIRNIVNCNGRILSADYLETTLTDVDFRIILSMYTWDDCTVTDLYSANYHMLPVNLRRVIMNYYTQKTVLKGAKEGTDEYIYYMNNKEMLNACYGMMVQDPCKDTLTYVGGEEVFIPENKSVADLLEDNNRKAFLNYAWGVWCTAIARKCLQDAIDAAGDNFVYCDTDSVKYIGDLDLTDYNNHQIEESIKWGAYAQDQNGEVHYLGVFEDEGYTLPNRFATMGAKKYVLEDTQGHLHITIAGVVKYIKDANGTRVPISALELGKLENFKEGFIFTKAGGNESIYNDNINEDVIIDGQKITITDNLVIRPSSYTLGITEEYRRVLLGLTSVKYSNYDVVGKYVVKS